MGEIVVNILIVKGTLFKFFQSDIKSFLSVFNFSSPCVSDIFYCPAHVVNSKIPYLKRLQGSSLSY